MKFRCEGAKFEKNNLLCNIKSSKSMTDQEFEKIWAEIEARNERQAAEWEALPEEEKERIFLEFTSDPANERIAGYRMERHKDADGKWVYETISELDDEK